MNENSCQMIGKIVEIVVSTELEKMRLHPLVGRKGVIVAKADSGKGYFVSLDKSYQNEEEWYIPTPSIQITDR